MNKEKLRKSVGSRVRLRPVAKRFDYDGREGPPKDDEWIIERMEQDSVELFNIRTHHVATLGLDHIHSFLSDPARDTDGLKHGFLQLNVQLSLKPREVTIEPLTPNYFRAQATHRSGVS